MMRRIVACLALIGTLGVARGDQVVLKNGDRVTGKIVKKEGAKLTFESDMFGTTQIPWENVTELVSEEALNVELPGGKLIRGSLTTQSGRVVVTAPEGSQSAGLAELPVIRNSAEQAAWERLQSPSWLQLWSGYADVGASMARGNAETTTVSTALNAARTTPTDKTRIYFNQIFSTATLEGVSRTTAKAIRSGWAYNRNLTSRAFLNVFNDWEYDQFQALDLRVALGAGAGYTIMKSERNRLDLLAGGAYSHEVFETPPTRNSGEIYWGNDWNYKLSGGTSFNQSFRMFNNLSNIGEFRMNFDAGTVTTLTKWLSWQFSYSDRYLSNPQGDRKKNDILLTTGVRVNFGKE